MEAVSKSRKLQLMAAVFANIMWFSAGTLLTWSSPATAMLQQDDSPFLISDREASWVGSMLPLGAVFGGPPFGMLVSRMGRKSVILALAFPVTLSWILIIKSTSLLYLARFLAGLSMGGVSFVIHIYLVEVLEPSIRRLLSSITQIACNAGMLYSYAVGAAGNYALLNYSCLAIPLVFVLLFVWMPETPQYLLSKNDTAAAEKSLHWLRGKDCDVQQELQAMKEHVAEHKRARRSMIDIITNPVALKALIISGGLIIGQQMSGVCVVLFYTQTIFKAVGSNMSDSLSSVAVGVVTVVMAFFTIPIVDHAGRRILLMVSSIFGVLTHFTLGLYFLLKEQLHEDMSGISWLPLVCIIVYIGVYCLGLGPLPWVVMSEVLPSNVKGSAGAIVTSCCWISAFILIHIFETFVFYVGRCYAFWFLSMNCCLTTIFIYFTVPETKGISLQDIQTRLAK